MNIKVLHIQREGKDFGMFHWFKCYGVCSKCLYVHGNSVFSWLTMTQWPPVTFIWFATLWWVITKNQWSPLKLELARWAAPKKFTPPHPEVRHHESSSQGYRCAFAKDMCCIIPSMWLPRFSNRGPVEIEAKVTKLKQNDENKKACFETLYQKIRNVNFETLLQLWCYIRPMFYQFTTLQILSDTHKTTVHILYCHLSGLSN